MKACIVPRVLLNWKKMDALEEECLALEENLNETIRHITRLQYASVKRVSNSGQKL